MKKNILKCVEDIIVNAHSVCPEISLEGITFSVDEATMDVIKKQTSELPYSVKPDGTELKELVFVIDGRVIRFVLK